MSVMGGRQVVRIKLGEPQQRRLLRDYFRRLGAQTRIEPDNTLSVHVSDSPSAAAERAEIKTYLDAWTARNGSSAELID